MIGSVENVPIHPREYVAGHDGQSLHAELRVLPLASTRSPHVLTDLAAIRCAGELPYADGRDPFFGTGAEQEAALRVLCIWSAGNPFRHEAQR
jgi:hypothetical protein